MRVEWVDGGIDAFISHDRVEFTRAKTKAGTERDSDVDIRLVQIELHAGIGLLAAVSSVIGAVEIQAIRVDEARVRAVDHFYSTTDIPLIFGVIHSTLKGQISLIEDYAVIAFRIESPARIDMARRLHEVVFIRAFDVAIDIDIGVFQPFTESEGIQAHHERSLGRGSRSGCRWGRCRLRGCRLHLIG